MHLPITAPSSFPGHTSATSYVMTAAATGVDCRRLDQIEPELRAGQPLRLIKIDVEGMEHIVLRSAVHLIRTHRPLLYVEVSARQLTRHFGSTLDIERFLVGHGYSMFRNVGPRNSSTDDYEIVPIDSLECSEDLFDCLAVPTETLAYEAANNPAIGRAW